MDSRDVCVCVGSRVFQGHRHENRSKEGGWTPKQGLSLDTPDSPWAAVRRQNMSVARGLDPFVEAQFLPF